MRAIKYCSASHIIIIDMMNEGHKTIQNNSKQLTSTSSQKWQSIKLEFLRKLKPQQPQTNQIQSKTQLKK
jgi:hypothetical protein